MTASTFTHLPKPYTFTPHEIKGAFSYRCLDCNAVAHPGDMAYAIQRGNKVRYVCYYCKGPLQPYGKIAMTDEKVDPAARVLHLTCPVCDEEVSLIPTSTWHVIAKHSNVAAHARCAGSDLIVFNAEAEGVFK